jgi:hypothetical protein
LWQRKSDIKSGPTGILAGACNKAVQGHAIRPSNVEISGEFGLLIGL